MFTSCSVVECWSLKPYYSGLSVDTIDTFSLVKKSFSKILPKLLKRKIGLWLIACFGFLPGFCNKIIEAFFQGFGKYFSLKQLLNIPHMIEIILRPLYINELFEIPSGTRAHLLGNFLIAFQISLGVTNNVFIRLNYREFSYVR